MKNKFDDLVLSFLHLQIRAGMDLKHLLQVLLATSPPQTLKNSIKDKIGVTFVFLAKDKNKTKFKIHDHLYFHQRWKMAHIVQISFFIKFSGRLLFLHIALRELHSYTL